MRTILFFVCLYLCDVLFRILQVSLQALEQSHNCHGAGKINLKNMGKIDWMPATTPYNKGKLSAYIS